MLFVFSLIVFTDRVPSILTLPSSPSTINPRLPLLFASKPLQLIPAEESNTVLLPTLKLLALTISASTVSSFNKTLSIVTPVLFVFSLIVSTDRLPFTFIFPFTFKFLWIVVSFVLLNPPNGCQPSLSPTYPSYIFSLVLK